MKKASKCFKRFNQKPNALRSGKTFNLTLFELKKQHRPMAGKIHELGWTIKGSAASPGITEGLAVVISGDEDLKRCEADRILVCPRATSELTPSLQGIKGLVTDVGGVMASIATIAREYGIPAVVGTSHATDYISDGDVIRVDGTTGCIRMVSRAQRQAS